jgi:acetyl-CoA acetyltransferase
MQLALDDWAASDEIIRILTTLLYALKDRGLRWGVAGICLGGGEAIALVVERI